MAEKYGPRRFEVYSLSWRDVEPFVVTAYGPDDAVEAWCQYQERNGNFSDGYPDQHELRVLDGSGEKVVVVTTEFQATYYITEKPDDR